jgi:exonuclease SbcD
MEAASLAPSLMKILHTADWHLGVRLIERDRLAEHAAFLDWLIETLRREKIDALLISGDVFDSANPPQDAVVLYFDFIRRLADLKTVRTVITGGNHDSATHLNAPRELLRRFEVHVFGHAGENVIDLGDAVIAAVPFLRERDLRQAAMGEAMSDVQAQVRAAIRGHYAGKLAESRALAKGRPMIAMGHLTALGALTSDSERDIHIGNLGAVGADVFAGFDYTALGHLHRPQRVASQEQLRYSGSPIALSFSEAADTKSVVILEMEKNKVTKIETLCIPVARALIRAAVDRATLHADLAALAGGCWAEITVKLSAPEADLDRQVRDCAGGRFDVLKVLADLPVGDQPAWQNAGPALDELQPRQVFHELLTERKIEDADLPAVFDELLALHEALVTA